MLAPAFIERMHAQLGDDAPRLFEALSEQAPTAILSNPLKGAAPPGEPVPWNPNGRYLEERPAYVKDPAYHAGAYYPQEASSMLIHHLVQQLDLPEHPLCLDACAAPGGKSLNLLHALQGRGQVVANEVIRSRVKILEENLLRSGHINFSISSIHPSEWASCEAIFDLLLVDAPCSGEGMFRKSQAAIDDWSPENVAFCASRQESILAHLIPSIKPGGYLVYSTCTFAPQENEQMMDYIYSQGLEPVPLSVEEQWGFQAIGDRHNALQAYPHLVRGEGLFISLFRRPGSPSEERSQASIGSTAFPLALHLAEAYEVHRIGDSYWLGNGRFSAEYEAIAALKGYFAPTIGLGEIKGATLLPAHFLAMSSLLQDIPSINLDYERAIAYLRRETFPLEAYIDGWYLARYGDHRLGWIKVAAGRMKNHYPKAWMIRKRW